MALGYHNLGGRLLEEDEHFSEIRYSVYWCYYLDKTLSMLLVKPPSLPSLNIEPVILVESKPVDPLYMKVKIFIRLARVQDGILGLLVKGDKLYEGQVPAVIPTLETELQAIWHDLCEVFVTY